MIVAVKLTVIIEVTILVTLAVAKIENESDF